MTRKSINELRARVKEEKALIHCITNPISINQCANAILALGARPMMAEHPMEVSEITLTAGALLLNLGNITDVRVSSMKISAETANKNNIPFILDAVGVACSGFRRNFTDELLSISHPSVIKGNYSEIMALYDKNYASSGVDASSELTKEDISKIAMKLAKERNTVILSSGKTDIITDGEKLCFINNGTPQLGTITGTGCMLGALTATFLSSASPFEAAVSAAAVLGICGEMAETDKGSGTFTQNLFDALSALKDEDIESKLKMEIKNEEI